MSQATKHQVGRDLNGSSLCGAGSQSVSQVLCESPGLVVRPETPRSS